jgi:hypothetical protein
VRHMRGMLVLAMGCAKQQPVEDWGDLDGTALLVDEPQQAFSERVQLEDLPRVRLLPDGPDLPQEGDRWPLPLVVADATPWPRVLVETYDLQVLVYVDRSALQSRVVALADGPVRIAPGTLVEELEEDGARVQVRARVGALTLQAWLPREAVDEVWGGSVPLPALRPLGVERTLLGGAEIRDRPGGTVLATVFDLDRLPVQPVWVDEGSRSRRHLSVTVATPEVQLQGWVREEDVTTESGFYGESVGCGTLQDSGSRFFLPRTFETFVPAGTLLAAYAGGPVVARTLVDVPVPASAREQGHLLRRRTVLGEIELWIAAADVW